MSVSKSVLLQMQKFLQPWRFEFFDCSLVLSDILWQNMNKHLYRAPWPQSYWKKNIDVWQNILTTMERQT